MKKGLVYILFSPNCTSVKIGRTELPIDQRIRALNASPTYGRLGAWALAHCLPVVDSVVVEQQLHKHFAEMLDNSVAGTRELFRVSAHEAIMQLDLVPESLRQGAHQAATLFKDVTLRQYLLSLMEKGGLFGALDQQGSWTLSLYPKTAGGRYFTLNVGRHEVAYATLASKTYPQVINSLVCDKLICDYPEVSHWLNAHEGDISSSTYASATDRAVSLTWAGDLSLSNILAEMPGIKTALIAYWQNQLSDMRLSGAKSFFARFHNYEAVNKLVQYRQERSISNDTSQLEGKNELL